MIKNAWLAVRVLVLCTSVTAGFVPAAQAQGSAAVEVREAWVRQSVPGQSATGGFMQLTAHTPLSLLGFATPVASSAQLHEMSMDGSTMRMREIDFLPLPAGQSVALQPGGRHLMLMGLVKALKAGDQVPLTLILRTPQGHTLKQEVVVPVRASAPPPSSPAP